MNKVRYIYIFIWNNEVYEPFAVGIMPSSKKRIISESVLRVLVNGNDEESVDFSTGGNLVSKLS